MVKFCKNPAKQHPNVAGHRMKALSVVLHIYFWKYNKDSHKALSIQSVLPHIRRTENLIFSREKSRQISYRLHSAVAT